MYVDTPKLLNNIENSKIRAYQNPIHEEKRAEICSGDQQSSPEDEIESMKRNRRKENMRKWKIKMKSHQKMKKRNTPTPHFQRYCKMKF